MERHSPPSSPLTEASRQRNRLKSALRVPENMTFSGLKDIRTPRVSISHINEYYIFIRKKRLCICTGCKFRQCGGTPPWSGSHHGRHRPHSGAACFVLPYVSCAAPHGMFLVCVKWDQPCGPGAYTYTQQSMKASCESRASHALPSSLCESLRSSCGSSGGVRRGDKQGYGRFARRLQQEPLSKYLLRGTKKPHSVESEGRSLCHEAIGELRHRHRHAARVKPPLFEQAEAFLERRHPHVVL